MNAFSSSSSSYFSNINSIHYHDHFNSVVDDNIKQSLPLTYVADYGLTNSSIDYDLTTTTTTSTTSNCNHSNFFDFNNLTINQIQSSCSQQIDNISCSNTNKNSSTLVGVEITEGIGFSQCRSVDLKTEATNSLNFDIQSNTNSTYSSKNQKNGENFILDFVIMDF